MIGKTFSAALITIAGSGLLSTSPASALPKRLLVEHGQVRTQIAARINSAPTVVFEAGLGDDMNTWAPIMDKIGTFASTFAYNRQGYGKSRPALAAPSPVAIARNLHEVLEQSAVPKPWVMVGHSLGGTYVMTFAKLYPADVKAVVLVDGTPPEQTRMLRTEMSSIYRVVKTLSSIMGGAAKAEFGESERAGDEYRALGPFPPIPVYLLRRSKWSPVEGAPFRARVVEMQKSLIGDTPCPSDREVDQSGHYIHRDRPEVVVDTIKTAILAVGCPR